MVTCAAVGRVTAIDPMRLARAVHLDVHQVAEAEWVVSGGRARHVVTLEPSGALCDSGVCTSHTGRR